MWANIHVNKSALKHGVSAEDIRYAILHRVRDIPFDETTEKNLIIGPTASGNLLEILYNEIDEHSVNVFHAMKLRKIYYPLLGL